MGAQHGSQGLSVRGNPAGSRVGGLHCATPVQNRAHVNRVWWERALSSAAGLTYLQFSGNGW